MINYGGPLMFLHKMSELIYKAARKNISEL